VNVWNTQVEQRVFLPISSIVKSQEEGDCPEPIPTRQRALHQLCTNPNLHAPPSTPTLRKPISNQHTPLHRLQHRRRHNRRHRVPNLPLHPHTPKRMPQLKRLQTCQLPLRIIAVNARMYVSRPAIGGDAGGDGVAGGWGRVARFGGVNVVVGPVWGDGGDGGGDCCVWF